MRPREIDVRIEELVLHGIPAVDALGVGEAAERELTRLLAHGDLPLGRARDIAVEHVDAGAFSRGDLTTPATIGGEIARAVHRGLPK